MAAQRRKTHRKRPLKYSLKDKLASTVIGLGMMLSAIPSPVYAQSPPLHAAEQAAIEIPQKSKIVVASPNYTKPANLIQESKTYLVEVSKSNSAWDQLAKCESGSNWQTNTGNGYFGGLQFALGSWQAVGGIGLPSEASRDEQIKRAQMLQSQGGWSHWPACSARLGLI